MRWSLVVAACVVVLWARAAGAQAPVAVEGDVVTYDALQQVIVAEGNVRTSFGPYRLFADAARLDLRTGVVTASGRVRLVGPRDQELRGRALTYNTRTEAGILEPAEGTVDRRLYLRGERLEVSPNRFVVHESTVTTCDPQQPLYRIVARRVEVVPNHEIVAHDASLYLGNRRLFRVMRYVVSLRPGVRTNAPGVGSNAVDGFWVDYRLPVRMAGGEGTVHLKYGVQTGPMALLTLTRPGPVFDAALRLGRTQTVDERAAFNLLRYDVAELRLATRPVQIGQTPLLWRVSAAAAWIGEQFSGVATTRLDAEAGIGTRPIALGPRWTVAADVGVRVSSYGTGASRTLWLLNASLAHVLDQHTTLTLGYQLVEIRGVTPLLTDVVDPANTTSIALARAVPGRYSVSGSVAWNRALDETRYAAAIAAFVTPTLELGASAVYNTRLAAFEDIDYAVRRICDCLEVVIRYRQIRREFSIQIGLTGY